MKREGRQHGMVQTYPIVQAPWNPIATTTTATTTTTRRSSTKVSSPASMAGPFTRVSQKPTNHSKFTGRCGRPRCSCCHFHPAGKSKDKAKGTQRLKSCDVVANSRLITWRVVDPRPGLKFAGFSATEVLDHLANDFPDEVDGGGSHVDDDDGDQGVCEYAWRKDVDGSAIEELPSTSAAINELDEIDGDDDERLSFCDVGFIWEQEEVGEEGDAGGWCLVEEI